LGAVAKHRAGDVKQPVADRAEGPCVAATALSQSRVLRAVATRDLQDLVEKGVLIKIGELQHTRYFLNIDERSES
jgi:hypothetical protein